MLNNPSNAASLLTVPTPQRNNIQAPPRQTCRHTRDDLGGGHQARPHPVQLLEQRHLDPAPAPAQQHHVGRVEALRSALLVEGVGLQDALNLVGELVHHCGRVGGLCGARVCGCR